MPDSDHWSASMLLCWVLTRDSDAVLSMVNDYGGWMVEGDNTTRIQPQTWDDVSRTYSIDDSLPKEEKARHGVLKAHVFVLPAWERIYRCLLHGEIDAWARPNGSGNIVKIEPIQWAGLRLHALEGHDIAVPVDSEQNPLRLQRPLADYLLGLVPATETPTVWPDPMFSAEQALELWPPSPAQISVASPPITPLRGSASVIWEKRRRGRPPKKRDQVEKAMRVAYAERYPELRGRTEEALCAEFGVSRTTIRNARERVLSLIVPNSAIE